MEELQKKKQKQLDLLDIEKKGRTAALIRELELKTQELIKDAQFQVPMLQ